MSWRDSSKSNLNLAKIPVSHPFLTNLSCRVSVVNLPQIWQGKAPFGEISFLLNFWMSRRVGSEWKKISNNLVTLVLTVVMDQMSMHRIEIANFLCLCKVQVMHVFMSMWMSGIPCQESRTAKGFQYENYATTLSCWNVLPFRLFYLMCLKDYDKVWKQFFCKPNNVGLK